MAYYLVDDFQRGLDVRRSSEVAPAGSLRVLRNAFVNAGGEIEKRRAFVQNAQLTAYGQDPVFKGKIVGPMKVPAYTNTVFMRHYVDALPGTPFTTGAGLSGNVYSEYVEDGEGLSALRFYVHKSYNATFGIPDTPYAMLHNRTANEFGSADYPGYSADDFAGQIYSVDRYYYESGGAVTSRTTHLQQYMLTNTGEPFEFDVDSPLRDRGPQITLSNKSWTIDPDILYASALGDPLDFVGTGAGSLKLSSQGSSIGAALALGVYYEQLAVFGQRGVQFYDTDPDFARTQYTRTVETSLFAPRSVTGYADGDVMYLSRTGIRSLQARDSSNLAITSDVGSPIDELIKDEIRYDPDTTETILSSTLPVADFFSLAIGIIYPLAGEFWLFLKDKVYVLSRHPAAKVLAWSQYDLPTPATANVPANVGPIKSQWCADAAQILDTITFRNFADEFFVYGGSSGEEYDESEVEVVTPFMDMERPGDIKYFSGIDLICEGKWGIEAAIQPKDASGNINWVKVAEIENSSRAKSRIPLNMQGYQIALRLTSISPFKARLAQIGVYFELGSQK